MDESRRALQKAVELAGGQAELARLIGGKVRQAHIWNWLNRDQRIPAERAIQVEVAVERKVTREQLRPDIFGKPSRAVLREVRA